MEHVCGPSAVRRWVRSDCGIAWGHKQQAAVPQKLRFVDGDTIMGMRARPALVQRAVTSNKLMRLAVESAGRLCTQRAKTWTAIAWVPSCLPLASQHHS
jgi:hypothetical protein